jgi:hypothetical protein
MFDTVPIGWMSSGDGLSSSALLLRDQEDLLGLVHCLARARLDRLLAPDEQRDDHVRVHHHVTQWQYRQHVGLIAHGEVSSSRRPDAARDRVTGWPQVN